MTVTYVTLYPPGGNSTTVQVVEGSQLHMIYAEMGFSATPSAPGPATRPDPFPQYVHDDEIGDLLADAVVPATDPVVAALVGNGGSQTGTAVAVASVAAVEDAETVAPTGTWDFTTAPTVGGAPISGGADAVKLTGDQTIAGAKTFTTGAKATRLGIGNHNVTDARQPFGANLTFDGSTLIDDTNTNKTASVLAVTFRGGFSNEAAWGVTDPNFLFGANDFIVTGTTSGDLAGITQLWGRLSEVHVATPGATLTDVYGFVAQANMDSTATSATVGGWLASLYATAPVKNAGGTVANAASLYVTSPVAGIATNTYALHVAGTAANYFGGQITANSGIVVNGAAGAFKVNAGTPNSQSAAVGVYAGVNTTDPGIELANGTSNWRIDNSAGLLRFLRAGVSSDMELTAGGHLKTKGGIGFFNTAAITAKRVTTPDATDLATAITLVNALKADLQAIGLKA